MTVQEMVIKQAIIVFQHCVAKSRNSAGVNFCTYDDYMTFTCSSALRWTNWKGTVIQGEMLQCAAVDKLERYRYTR